MSSLLGASKSRILFYPGDNSHPQGSRRSKQEQARAEQLSRDIKILNEGMPKAIRAAVERLSKEEITVEISDHPISKSGRNNKTLPTIKVDLPNMDPGLLLELGRLGRDTCQADSNPGHTWTFSVQRDNRKKDSKSDSPDTKEDLLQSEKEAPDEDDDSVEEDASPYVSENLFSLDIESPINKIHETNLTATNLCQTFADYLGELIQYASFPLDKTAKQIFENEAQSDELKSLSEKYAQGLNKGLARDYTILDKFFNSGLTVREIAKEYPRLSIKHILKLINSKEQFMQGIESLSLEDYVFDDSVFCQVIVDLNEPELKILEQAVRELREERPEILSSFDFIVVKKDSGDIPAYVDSFSFENKIQRKNLLVIGNTETGYENIVQASTSSSRAGLSFGFFALLRVFGQGDQSTLSEVLPNAQNESPEESVSSINLVAFPADTETDILRCENLAKAGLQNIVFAAGGDNVTILKNKLLKVFQSPQLASSILRHKISPELRNLINKTKAPTKPKFEGDTLLSFMLWYSNGKQSSSLPFVKLCKDCKVENALRLLMRSLEKINVDSKDLLQVEIETLSQEIKAVKIAAMQEQAKLDFNALVKGALPLILPKSNKGLSVPSVENESLSQQLETHLRSFINLRWPSLWAERSALVPGLKSFMEEIFQDRKEPNLKVLIGSSVDEDVEFEYEQITNLASRLIRGENINQELRGIGKKDPKLKYRLAARILAAIKSQRDSIWVGVETSQRNISPTDIPKIAAGALNTLGMINFEILRKNREELLARRAAAVVEQIETAA